MAVPQPVIDKLVAAGISYQLIETPQPMGIQASARHLGKKSAHLLRSVALESQGKVILAVLPFHAMLDVAAIAEQTESEYQVLGLQETQKLFRLCGENSFPPVADLHKFKLILEPSILDMSQVVLQSGDPSVLIQLDKVNLNLLYQECDSFSFAINLPQIIQKEGYKQASQPSEGFTSLRMKQRIDEIFDLPTMPEIAQDIMKLRVDPSADATRLAQIVARDPSLATQVISWASSPYYGYQGKIDSIETAIARVLGFELVMNLALGISIGKSLSVPYEGPIGLLAYWKHAIYCANLAEKLCCIMPIKQRPDRGLVYLSGLLHNFGHLLLGHIFRPQFKLVNLAIEANPHIEVEIMENHILGITHQEIGSCLMKNWHMPEEVIAAVNHHSDESFWSKHAIYSNIILLANNLLNQMYVEQRPMKDIPESVFELLAIDKDSADSALKAIKLEAETLDVMVKQLVA